MGASASSRRSRSARSGNPSRIKAGLIMEFFRIRRTIPFMRHALILNLISLLTFVLAVFFIATRGFHLSIEFTGGTVVEVHYSQAAPVGDIRNAIEGLGYTDFQVQNFGTSQDVMIRL